MTSLVVRRWPAVGTLLCAPAIRFLLVGLSGYVINLSVFAIVLRWSGQGHAFAAVVAFAVTYASNFWWHRTWTFSARTARASHQAARFFLVSLVAFCGSLALLELFITVLHVPAVASQFAALLIVAPLSFAINQSWTYATA